MRRAGETVVVLGEEGKSVERMIESGRFMDESEVLRAGVRALEREEEQFDRSLRDKVREAMDDPRPGVPADEVFARLRERQKAR